MPQSRRPCDVSKQFFEAPAVDTPYIRCRMLGFGDFDLNGVDACATSSTTDFSLVVDNIAIYHDP